MTRGYTIELFYSEEDEGYIAVVPELPGCSAFGSSEEEALKEAKIAIDLWVETAERAKREVPRPIGREILRALLKRANTVPGAGCS
ncbi:MAG: type II toxin-antitoxin system HicB family antitoxin [Methanotrichaceae archaeon]|nr:type II toxin-antitoxin system HicB family antitoxin [Methanotrichaceae archaeon]